MRIRKRPSAAAATAANDADATTITEALQLCQLNQSPWDVFPPSPRRRDSYSDDDPEPRPSPPPFPLDTFSGRQRFFAKRTATNVVGATERKKKRVIFNGGASDGDGAVDEFKEEDEVVLCPKTDKKGWQCGSVVKKGNSVCDKHLPVTSGKNSGGRKSLTNSGEFYYYTGFGPARGKKRGNNTSSSTSVKPSEESSTDGGSDGSKNGAGFGKSEVGFDDDDSEDEDDNGIGRSVGRKRGRRMVRSLKSLM